MKRTIRGLRLLLCAALAAGLLAVPARAVVPSSSTLAPYAASKTYLVNCSGLNLRYAASVTSEVQFVLPRGATVTYLSDKSGWWYVSYRKNSTTYYGWVDKKYLAPAFTGASVGRYAVTASQLNVRSYPRLSARRVGGLARGTVINISELNGDWGYSATVGRPAVSDACRRLRPGRRQRHRRQHLSGRGHPAERAQRGLHQRRHQGRHRQRHQRDRHPGERRLGLRHLSRRRGLGQHRLSRIKRIPTDYRPFRRFAERSLFLLFILPKVSPKVLITVRFLVDNTGRLC